MSAPVEPRHRETAIASVGDPDIDAEEWRRAVGFVAQALADQEAAPVPVVLHCPACHGQHVDCGEWTTKPHRMHRCEHCGNEWRPSDRNTVGVAQVTGVISPFGDYEDDDDYPEADADDWVTEQASVASVADLPDGYWYDEERPIIYGPDGDSVAWLGDSGLHFNTLNDGVPRAVVRAALLLTPADGPPVTEASGLETEEDGS